MPTRRTTNTETHKAARDLEIMGQIRREALEHGASKIFLFGQAAGSLRELLTKSNDAKGVCRALTIDWLVDQQGGRELTSSLLGFGGAVDPVKAAKYLRPNLKMKDAEEKAFILTELSKRGLRHGADAWSAVTSVRGGVGSWFVECGVPTDTLRYIMIEYGCEHAMGLNLRTHTFFDPNWGVFQFPTALQLKAFLDRSIFVRGTSPGTCEYAGIAAFVTVRMLGFS